MFGAGWTEMIIIGVVALVVIGPKDLPIVMRKLGRVVATVRRMGSEFQSELNKTTGLDQITDLKRSITEPLRQTSDEIVREFNKVTAAGTVEPSGVIKPTDPAVESVYDQIAATSGLPPAAPPPVMKPMATIEPSPAPAEASVLPPTTDPALAKPKRAARAKSASADAPQAKKSPASAKVWGAKSTTAMVAAATPAEARPAAPVAETLPAETKGEPLAAAKTPSPKPARRAAAAKAVPAETASVSAAVAANGAAPAEKPARSRTRKASQLDG